MSSVEKEIIPITKSKKNSDNSAVLPPLKHSISDMERSFDQLMGRGWPTVGNWNDTRLGGNLTFEMRVPSLDVVDREHELCVRAEMPGVEKKDIHVALNGNLLTINGQISKKEKEEKGDYFKHEISKSSFARTVTLLVDVDVTKAEANLKHGILEIILPKTVCTKRRFIEIK